MFQSRIEQFKRKYKWLKLRYGYFGQSETSSSLMMLKTDLPKLALAGAVFGVPWAFFLLRAMDVIDFI